MSTLMPTQPVGLDRLESFAFGLDHSEGIAVTPRGDIYVGGEAGQIYRIVDDKPQQVATTGGFLLGLAADGEGRIYAVDTVAKTVWRFDPQTGELTTFVEGDFKLPNWGSFGVDGTYYLTDSGGWMAGDGCIWAMRPGERAELWTRESHAFPNGSCLSPDGSRLYVAESVPGAIVAFDILADGRAGRRVLVCELGLAVPDGIAFTTDGSLVISCYRPDAIYRWHPADGLDILAADPRGTVLAAPTNVAFAGPDLATLVVPNLGRWHLTRGQLGLTGVPLNYPGRELIG